MEILTIIFVIPILMLVFTVMKHYDFIPEMMCYSVRMFGIIILSFVYFMILLVPLIGYRKWSDKVFDLAILLFFIKLFFLFLAEYQDHVIDRLPEVIVKTEPGFFDSLPTGKLLLLYICSAGLVYYAFRAINGLQLAYYKWRGIKNHDY